MPSPRYFVGACLRWLGKVFGTPIAGSATLNNGAIISLHCFLESDVAAKNRVRPTGASSVPGAHAEGMTQLSQLENDIALWKNNLEFFADSKTADKLKEEFDAKIKTASNELRGLKHQLKLVKNYS